MRRRNDGHQHRQHDYRRNVVACELVDEALGRRALALCFLTVAMIRANVECSWVALTR